VIDVETPTQQLLVLSDLYYPGWRADLDGASVTVHRTNHAMRGVVVPPGTHRLTFRYEPSSVRIGAWISAAGMGALLLMTWRRRPRASPGETPAVHGTDTSG
jgi:uncharacterized membrane protein YfhO